ncbi:MAG TPA: PEP-CTERM sorting domain-containing protein [Vicinamibacterales bacterium]|nr:PEP-CTERM sorting domain-containing protein [Vicinamibacterales bacterium]
MRFLTRTFLAMTGVLVATAMASATPITITGAATGSLSTATGNLTVAGDTLTLQLTNTSPYDARITALGFDLFAGDFLSSGPSSGLDGYLQNSGSSVGSFVFSDGALGTVPQFAGHVLDFGWQTGSNFAGGFPNSGLSPFSTLTFIVSGSFFGLTEAQIANMLFVRFQQVGDNGDDSDVGRGRVSEPVSLLLFGAGLAGVALVRRRRAARQ